MFCTLQSGPPLRRDQVQRLWPIRWTRRLALPDEYQGHHHRQVWVADPDKHSGGSRLPHPLSRAKLVSLLLSLLYDCRVSHHAVLVQGLCQRYGRVPVRRWVADSLRGPGEIDQSNWQIACFSPLGHVGLHKAGPCGERRLLVMYSLTYSHTYLHAVDNGCLCFFLLPAQRFQRCRTFVECGRERQRIRR